MKRLLAIFIPLLGVLLGCGDTYVLNYPKQNAWGMEYTFHPIKEAEPSLRELGRAVGFVRLAEGNGGSGFFVSSDGLFLTNHHVLPSDRCFRDRCAGVQIIRDFHEDGDFEVFNEMHVVAQSKDLDFTLLQVKVEKVPFIEQSRRAHLQEKSLLVLGHPLGASLQWVNAEVASLSDKEITMQAPITSGFSGGPIIDPYGRFVGIAKAISPRFETIEKVTGQFQILAIGAFWGNKVESIKQVLSMARIGSDPITLSEVVPNTFKPRSLTEISAPEIENFNILIGAFIGTPSEAAATHRHLVSQINLGQSLEMTLQQLMLADLARGQTNTEVKNLIPSIHDGVALETLQRLHYFYHEQDRAKCLRFASGLSPIEELNYVGETCHSERTYDGDRVTKRLIQTLEANKTVSGNLLRMATHIVMKQAALGGIAPQEKRLLLPFLDLLYEKSPYVVDAYTAEGIRTIISRDVTVLGPGAFQKSFADSTESLP